MKAKVTALKNAEANILNGYYTVADAAKKLGVSSRRVRQFISEGRLRAMKVGKQYLITIEALGSFIDKPRTVGRPAGSKNKPKPPDKI